MTSRISTASNDRSAGRIARRVGGFSLVEMLVAISILIILAALLMPAIGRARRSAMRVRVASDLQAISGALEAYKNDQRAYPRVLGPPVAGNYGFDGAVVLCQALMGPTDTDDLDDDDGDGNLLTNVAAEKKDLGFRVRQGEKVYGPYLSPGTFKMVCIKPDVTAPEQPEQFYVLLASDERPVLYFPASQVKLNLHQPKTAARPATYFDLDSDTSPNLANNATDVSTMYDPRDNFIHGQVNAVMSSFGPFGRNAADSTNALKRMKLVLGDDDMDGWLGVGEREVGLPFLLWAAGPDAIYGPDQLNATGASACDDVTNFR